MQNPILKRKQSSIISEKPSFVWKIQNFDKLQLLQSWIFFVEILRTFHLKQSLQKGVQNLLCLDLKF